jgi:hypothetical protein
MAGNRYSGKRFVKVDEGFTATWSNYGVPSKSGTFLAGQVLSVQSSRPEGVMVEMDGGDAFFLFARDLDAHCELLEVFPVV